MWLDYFIPSRRGRSVAIEFLRDACTAQVDLLYAATSSKDLFYLISSEHKAWYRREHGSLSQYAATVATSLAWDCLSVLSQLATPVPCDLSDIWMASRQRELHSDYEDDLIIAAAIRAQADLLVTNECQTLFTRTRRSNERRRRKKLSNNAQIALNLTGRIISQRMPPRSGPRQPVPTG